MPHGLCDDAALSETLQSLTSIAREVAVALYFDAAMRQVGARHFMSDRRASVDVPIRRIVADVLALDSRAVLLAHNHPRGDSRPSREDLRFTRRLFATLDSVGVRLLDHYVVARDEWTSFQQVGLL